MPSAAFTKAYNEASKLETKPSTTDQLEIYALAKFAQGEQPKEPTGMFDMQGKAKLKEFNKVKDSGITAEQADAKYVEKINQFKTKYGFKG